MLVFKVLRIQTLKQINNFYRLILNENQRATYGKAKLTWFEEIFEEYKQINPPVI